MKQASTSFVVFLLAVGALLNACAQPALSPGTVGPTTGHFVNGTRWRVEVFVDADPRVLQSAPGIVLNPRETRQHSLDFAAHRVIAWAYVDTQLGTRTVGWYDRTILVEPDATTWTLRFNEADFHAVEGPRETTTQEANKRLEVGPTALRRQDYHMPHTSLRELKRAALQGHIVAQFNLGWMYAKGEGGVAQDYAQAAKWYRMAAEQGDAWAQNSLGEMYARGEGVPRNVVQAYMWLSLAIKGGYKPAVTFRGRLAKKMTTAQIAEAERLATEREEKELTTPLP